MMRIGELVMIWVHIVGGKIREARVVDHLPWHVMTRGRSSRALIGFGHVRIGLKTGRMSRHVLHGLGHLVARVKVA